MTRNWPGAEREYKRAIELSPSCAIAHPRYATYLPYLARRDEAIAEIKPAQELDLLSLVIQNNVGIVLYYARRYDAATLESRNTLEIDPGNPLVIDGVWALIFAHAEDDPESPRLFFAADCAFPPNYSPGAFGVITARDRDEDESEDDNWPGLRSRTRVRTPPNI
jgi:tetratricopeptide (TPR) repeat protein